MNKELPKPTISSILKVFLLITIVCMFSAHKDLKQPIRPLLQQSRLYLDSKSVSPVTIKVRVLGSITNPTIRALAFCESSLNPNAYNPNDPNGGSHGLLQFSRDTFQEFCVEKYGLKNDLYDPEIQILCATRMIKDGYEQRWSCWEMIQ